MINFFLSDFKKNIDSKNIYSKHEKFHKYCRKIFYRDRKFIMVQYINSISPTPLYHIYYFYAI